MTPEESKQLARIECMVQAVILATYNGQLVIDQCDELIEEDKRAEGN